MSFGLYRQATAIPAVFERLTLRVEGDPKVISRPIHLGVAGPCRRPSACIAGQNLTWRSRAGRRHNMMCSRR